MHVFLVNKGATYEAEEVISIHKKRSDAIARCRELAQKTLGKVLSEWNQGEEFHIECEYCYYTIECMKLE